MKRASQKLPSPKNDHSTNYETKRGIEPIPARKCDYDSRNNDSKGNEGIGESPDSNPSPRLAIDQRPLSSVTYGFGKKLEAICMRSR